MSIQFSRSSVSQWSGPMTQPVSSSAPTGASYSAYSEDLIDAFYNSLRVWRKETYALSSPAAKMQHPAFKRIVALGQPAIPLIVRELRSKPDFLFLSLHEITGVNPVPPSAAGKIREVIDAWLAWADRTQPDVL